MVKLRSSKYRLLYACVKVSYYKDRGRCSVCGSGGRDCWCQVSNWASRVAMLPAVCVSWDIPTTVHTYTPNPLSLSSVTLVGKCWGEIKFKQGAYFVGLQSVISTLNMEATYVSLPLKYAKYLLCYKKKLDGVHETLHPSGTYSLPPSLPRSRV